MDSKVFANDIDPLTGLKNFRAYLAHASAIADEDIAAGVYPARDSVCFDICNFRHYNALYGMNGGDALLQKVAEILSDAFGADLVCRRGADKFIALISNQTGAEQIEKVCRQINEFIHHPGVVIKAGIYRVTSEDDLHTNEGILFDKAKLACDSIKDSGDKVIAYYTQQMEAYDKARSFILENFDRALKDGTIHVVFQPVVRSLTGKFCNSEALSRWEDPQFGSISPAIFIKVLEEARLIHKLDRFVLQKSCEIMRYEIDHDIPCVPVSINFSRLDFVLMDPFAEVQKVMHEYGLPSSQLAVEITESTLLLDQSVLKKQVEQFHAAGYEVWLDDFGSGYSSLNVLNEFPVDEIKLDMVFLRNYNEKSKSVIRSIILMAKNMKLHTLAEGVETKEQADFLISIGCEKMQGYYYAKPMGLNTAIDYPDESRISVETPEEEQLLNTSGAVNVITDTPVAFSVYDGKTYRMLYVNEAFLNSLKDIGFDSMEEANRIFAKRDRTENERIAMFVQEAQKTGKASIVYLDHGQYMRHSAVKLSQAGSLTLFQDELINLNMKNNMVDLSRFDRQVRNLTRVCSEIYYFHGDNGLVEVLKGKTTLCAENQSLQNAAETIEKYCRAYIHPDDQEHFLSFMNRTAIYQASQNSVYHNAVSVFRRKDSRGRWSWMVFDAIVLTDMEEKDILLSVREDILKDMAVCGDLPKEYLEEAGKRRNTAE